MSKKRAASQRVPAIVETRQEAAQKPLKLVLKPPPEAKRARVSSLLEQCLHLETADQVLEHLLQINETQLPLLVENLEQSISRLSQLWRVHELNTPICSVVARITAELARRADSLPCDLQEFVLSLVKHDCTDVKVVALKCFQQITMHFSSQAELCQLVQQIVQKEIRNIHHAVRLECLRLIGQLSHVTEDSESSLALLEEYCNDEDPRVRAAAFEALFSINQRGSALPLSLYYKSAKALQDDSEDVRLVAVKLVCALGLAYGGNTIPLKPDSSVEIRLLDDAFIKICDMVNDLSMTVRALAAGLLGDFRNVSVKFLEQTLDKKLMSHLRVVKSEHERQRELHARGGSMDWDSGKSWGGSVPQIQLDPGEMTLMSAGACGAFVHGLEDEFMEVRSAAVESVCRLGMQCQTFATQSLDFLVDMFNDEIQSVRLCAINCLRRVSTTMHLREDQLETVLSVLEESSPEIREALHALLSSCRLTSPTGLNSTIHALLDSLKKYPSDRQSVWRCLQHLGVNHGSLVSTLVPELLSTHPFFMGKEPDVDDPAYICILILVFNAAVRCPTIAPQFPSHVFRHYTYLRDTLPDLIPGIKIGMPAVMRLNKSSRSTGQSGGRPFLCQVLSRARSASSLPACRDAQRTWQACISDLQRVSKLDSQLAAVANCSATFLQCQLLMQKVNEVLSQDVLLSSEAPGHSSVPHTITSIKELLLLSYRLEHTFPHLSSSLLLQTRLIRTSAHAMLLLLAMQLDWDAEHSNRFAQMKLGFLDRLKSIKSFCDSHQLTLPSILAPLMELDLITVAVESLSQHLQPLVTGRFCTDIAPGDLSSVRQCRAELHDPQNFSQDDFTKFVASLALSVHVDASLHSVTQPERIAVQVKFPDGRKLLLSPKPSDIRQLGVNEAKLDTSTIISHGIWTDPCQVELCVVMRYPTDVREDGCFPFITALQNQTHPPSAAGHKPPHSRDSSLSITGPSGGHIVSNAVHSHPEDSLDEEKSVLAISEVVRINVHPQENSSKSYNVFGP